jgi:hypothetical protein
MTSDELRTIIKFVEQIAVGEKQQTVLKILKKELNNRAVKAKVPRLFQPYKGESNGNT